MWPYMDMGSMGLWMIVWPIVGLVLLLVLLRGVLGVGRGATTEGTEPPEQILKRRYAKGEIEREEYQKRLQDLRR
jgi:putative membrane protein